MNDDQIIQLESADGRSFDCKILGVFPCDGQDYAILVNLATSSTVMMRLMEEEDSATLQTIESDEEFERVTTHFRESVV